MKDQIIKISAAQNADYLFMGYYGRKGKKEDRAMMGSSLKATAYNIKAPLFIVRNIWLFNSQFKSKYYYERDIPNKKGFQFLVCLDGSENAFKALNYALDLVHREHKDLDAIHAVTVTESDPSADKNVKYVAKVHTEFCANN